MKKFKDNSTPVIKSTTTSSTNNNNNNIINKTTITTTKTITGRSVSRFRREFYFARRHNVCANHPEMLLYL